MQKINEQVDNKQMDINQVISICNLSGFDLPDYADEGSVGVDLKAAIHRLDPTSKFLFDSIVEDGKLTIYPGGRALVPTGLFFAIPNGLELQIRPRSGKALKQGLTVLNTPGTIDPSYRGEVGIIAFNASNKPIVIEDGDAIAQGVFAPYAKVFGAYIVDDPIQLGETERGAGGFGHTDEQSKAE